MMRMRMMMRMKMTKFRYCKLTSVITHNLIILQPFLSHRQHSALLFCSSINTHTNSRLEHSVSFRGSIQRSIKCSLFIPLCFTYGKGIPSIRTYMECYFFKNKYVQFQY